MAKRKSKLVPETMPIDSAISISEVLGHQISEHTMSLCEKMTKEEAEDKSSSFELSYPCQQLNRRVKPKNAISKKKKLDGGAFESHLGKHIFSKKYVFVPIICWSHWSLLIFCHFGESLQSKTRTPCMLLLDSLEMGNPRRLEPNIRKFVLDIYEAEGRFQVSQQRNGEECGQFVLYFMKLFMEGSPEGFSIGDYPYFMKKIWFTPEGLDSFCQKLYSLKKGN
ncbi:hypothetical protein I3842_12G034200 [Carya illinoinensis]|uniref:Ubiquitin-like protease family profile domain-containing protein n=1 Tax=Carya illinoinensis TaxID=32201 RepID=A0A922IUW9_CARIL|nr:hypothetical protein I3842_12G034200 [Carya illinoinensis]